MSTDLNASFNEQFMNINTKLKKRFMRKPNVTEATNEFIALAIQCEYSEQPMFAGHSYIGAAKCEATVGDFLGEAEHYTAAARQFMKAEKKLSSLKFYSPDRENLEAAIGCFMQALSKYPETSPIRTCILMELAHDLVTLNLVSEAVEYYAQALLLVEEPGLRVMMQRNFINLLIDCGKYEFALEKANELIDSKQYLPADIRAELQMSRVLLALCAERESAAALRDGLSCFNADVRVKLQSLIISVGGGAVGAVAEGDAAAAVAALRPALSPRQERLALALALAA